MKNNLPESSRVWVYQSDTPFNEQQVAQVQDKLTAFVKSWEAHGKALQAAAEILHGQFIVLCVDEGIQHATGCSIDKSVALIKEIEKVTGTDLMNRMNVSFLVEGEVVIKKMMDFRALINSGEVDEHTIVFNNLVKTKGEFISSWKVPAGQSWHQQLLI